MEKNIDMRTTLRYLGVPIIGPSQMFGDNESVVNRSMKFHVNKYKRHNVLSFHQLRESIAADIFRFHHVHSEDNPSDILSKHWSYNCIWKLTRLILFWRGYTALIQPNDEISIKDESSQL